MSNMALFINGIYEGVLEDIVAVQSQLPEQILFLQPHGASRIVQLANNPPSVDKPMRLFASITTELNKVSYTAEIVGWEDKQSLTKDKEMILNRIVYMFLRTEPGIYKSVDDKICKNLLYVRRMKKLRHPFPVDELVKLSDDEPVGSRTTSGGYAYVEDRGNQWLEQWL